jgi:hypothetical protein
VRGGDNRTGELFGSGGAGAAKSCAASDNEALSALEHEFAGLYSPIGRPSIPPESC